MAAYKADIRELINTAEKLLDDNPRPKKRRRKDPEK
jgi:hypothetical protein